MVDKHFHSHPWRAVPVVLSVLLLCCSTESPGEGTCEERPPEEIDNEAACFGDGGMPECQCNATIICGHVRGRRWYHSTEDPNSPPFILSGSSLGQILILNIDPAADWVAGQYLQFIVQPDGDAWCWSYSPVELSPDVIAQCTEDPPSSRVEYVDDNRITFRIDGVAVVDEGERLSVCDHEPVDGSLKGCANLPGVGALLRP